MARTREAAAPAPQARLAALLDACRGGKPAPVIVLVGEPAETRRAAEAIVDAVVPPERRAFNLETVDGRTTPLAAVIDSLRTPAFFPGAKLVWVRETGLFLSGDKKGDVARAMLAAWEGGRRKDAAEKMATLLALAGWTTERVVESDLSAATKTALREAFGDEGSAADGGVLRAIQQELIGRDLKLAGFRDESALLQEYLDGGAMPETVLLFTTSAVDARKRIVKAVQDAGAFVELVVERERSGALTRDSVAAIAAERCAAAGKKLQRGALDLVVRRAGQDVAALGNELDKLCLYVGERPTIEDEDVRSVFLDMAESWIFDFTGAFSTRSAAKTVPLLRGLLDQGEPALRILAMVAREIRLLLLARESIDAGLQGVWRDGMTYAAFQTRVLPALDGATKAAFGRGHPFALFRRFEDAARIPAPRLRRALVDVADLDVRFKSTGTDPRLLLETFVIGWCR